MKSSKKISINQIETGSLVTTNSFNEFTSSYNTAGSIPYIEPAVTSYGEIVNGIINANISSIDNITKNNINKLNIT